MKWKENECNSWAKDWRRRKKNGEVQWHRTENEIEQVKWKPKIFLYILYERMAGPVGVCAEDGGKKQKIFYFLP